MNFLSPINFSLKLDKIPNVEYQVQSITIPGISMSTINLPTPFTVMPEPGRPEFQNIGVVFKVGENLEGYKEIHEWIAALSMPLSYEQHQREFSDGTVFIMNSSRRPNAVFRFKGLFPISLGSITLDTTMTSMQYVTVEAQFRYLNYTLEIV